MTRAAWLLVLEAAVLAVVLARRRRHRRDRQWAAEVAGRIRIAETLNRMERDLAGSGFEALTAMLRDGGER